MGAEQYIHIRLEGTLYNHMIVSTMGMIGHSRCGAALSPRTSTRRPLGSAFSAIEQRTTD